MKTILIHRGRTKLQKDGWTYGDWRQYVAFFEDKSAQCVRMSGLPGGLFITGFVALSIAGMGVAMACMGVPIYWSRVIPFGVLGIALMLPAIIEQFTPWRLVVPVSEKMLPDEDGGYTRNI